VCSSLLTVLKIAKTTGNVSFKPKKSQVGDRQQEIKFSEPGGK